MGILRSLLVVICLLGLPSFVIAGPVPSPVINAISNGVVEVILKKPVKDPLSYERPLPLELLPYAIRTDKYIPVGTAFALGSNQFVTAAHVLNLEYVTQFDSIYIRDQKGRIFEIDTILSYSTRKDYAVFSVKKNPQLSPISRAQKSLPNTVVYTVGNALGEGIVIREGLYTSQTFEEESGEWKWIRFSAAASPGNSGGPLLNNKGEVVGVITRKSPNENLNYALPIQEVVVDYKINLFHRLTYRLQNLRYTVFKPLNYSGKLPQPLPKVRQELTRVLDGFSQQMLQDLFTQNQSTLFPHGEGSKKWLSYHFQSTFPGFFGNLEYNNWDFYRPNNKNKVRLPKNGAVQYGTLGDMVVAVVEKPDNVSVYELWKDSKLFMDSVLQGVQLTRVVDTQEIVITSLGKASRDTQYTDSYGRKWAIRDYLMPHNDKVVRSISLPVPNGMISIMNISDTGNTSVSDDLKALTRFIYLSYYGTFKEWSQFLKYRDLLPSELSTFQFSYSANAATIQTDKFKFRYDESILPISDASFISLGFGYYESKNKVVWGVVDTLIGADKHSDSVIALTKSIKPGLGVDDEYLNTWNRKAKGIFPYDKEVYTDDGNTIIRTPSRQYLNLSGNYADQPNFLYTITARREGNVSADKMRQTVDKIDRFFQVIE